MTWWKGFYWISLLWLCSGSNNCLYPTENSVININEIQHWYNIGKQQCNAYLKNSSNLKLLTTLKTQKYLVDWSQNQPRPQCRGVEMLYQLTNHLPWVFGPQNCRTHATCWIGVLTCHIEEDSNPLERVTTPVDMQVKVKEYLKKSGLAQSRWDSLHYNGWSIESLNIQMRLVNAEIISPVQEVVSLQIGSQIEKVIIGKYFVTVPGKYLKEAKLVDLYPMKLFSWTNSERQKGYDMWFPVYLGGHEPRCRPYQGCSLERVCCNCFAHASILQASPSVDVTDGLSACLDSMTANPNRKKEINHHLPYCPYGNHSGRWLKVLPTMLERCKVKKMQVPPKEIWSDLEHPSHSISNRIKLTSSEDILKFELSRYSNHQMADLCQLYYDGEVKQEHDSQLEIFAPYQCQYRIYSKEQGRECLDQNSRTQSYFHGDSHVREISGHISAFLGISTLTLAQMKNLTNVQGIKDLRMSDRDLRVRYFLGFDLPEFERGLTEFMSTDPPYDVYLTNYGFTHNLINSSDYLHYYQSMTSTPFYHSWKSISSLPTKQLRIFQSARHMSSLFALEGGFGGQLRNLDKILYQIFVDEFHFHHLDLYEITRGKYDYVDGLHLRGAPSKMSAMILLNMMCNL